MLTSVFVTGTDTGVGKTIVTAALARHLRRQGLSVGVMKPIETGVDPREEDHSDAGRLKSAADVTDPVNLISPYRFAPPVAPLAAARAAGVEIDLQAIRDAFDALTSKHDLVLVEGVGGVLVPIGTDWDVRDLIGRLNASVVVVGRAGLGGVNHALLTVEALRGREAPMIAVVLNQSMPPSPGEEEQVRSTVALLRECLGNLEIVLLDHRAELAQAWDNAITILSESPAITRLAARLLQDN